MRIRNAIIGALGLTLSGCGLRIPPIAESGSQVESQDFIQEILVNIKCELRSALTSARDAGPNAAFLDEWGVQTTLTLKYDESGSIAPGVIWTPVSPATAVFTLAAGVNYSANASQENVINAYYLVSDLNKSTCSDGVRPNGAFLLQSDLKLTELLSTVIGASTTRTVDFYNTGAAVPANVIQQRIKFEVVTGGALTPSYKLVRVAFNPGGDVFTASRTRTHELLITLAPASKTIVDAIGQSGRKVKRVLAQPTRQGAEIHFSTLVGSSIEAGVRSAFQR